MGFVLQPTVGSEQSGVTARQFGNGGMTSVPLRSSTGPRANTQEFRITSTVGPWTTEAWQEELEALTRHVKRCFDHATPRFVSPSEDGCRYFANCLMTYFLPGEKRPPGSKEKAVKHGRTFLKHLAQERETIELGLRVNIAFKLDEETRQKSESTLFHMREVEQHLEYLFDYFPPNVLRKTTGSVGWQI
jgi:hypothetical protein